MPIRDRRTSVSSRLDAAFWRLPLPFHYGWVAIVYLAEAITGSANPKAFENVAKLRRERLASRQGPPGTP